MALQEWRMEVNETHRLQFWEEENGRLKRLVADQAMLIQILMELKSKIVSSSTKRRAVKLMIETGIDTMAEACRALGLARSNDCRNSTMSRAKGCFDRWREVARRATGGAGTGGMNPRKLLRRIPGMRRILSRKCETQIKIGINRTRGRRIANSRRSDGEFGMMLVPAKVPAELPATPV
jgi:hypothetical protein